VPPDHVQKVSDANWLQIIDGKNWANRKDRWLQVTRGVVGEVSVRTFASDFRSAAHHQPERFAKLALRIPPDANGHYLSSLLDAFRETKPPQNFPSDLTWERAPHSLIEQIMQRFGHRLDNTDFAQALCRAVEARADEEWSDACLRHIMQIAVGHADPERDYFSCQHSARGSSGSTQEMEPDLESSALNCARGAAARCIAGLLFERTDRFTLLKPAIEALVIDGHPSVRMASVGIALAMMNVNQSDAVNLCIHACHHDDDGILVGHELQEFLSYTVGDFLDRLLPLIHRMINSTKDNVAKAGASWAAVVFAHDGRLSDLVQTCVDGSQPKRLGVAEVLSRESGQGRTGEPAREIVAQLFKDADADVRARAASVLFYDKVWQTDFALPLAHRLLKSEAAGQSLDRILHSLKDTRSSLAPYGTLILEICRLIADRANAPQDGGRSVHSFGYLLSPVLLRLYEQSEGNRDLRRQCLNAWDALLQARVGLEALSQLEQ
jgi:hypothetical protein